MHAEHALIASHDPCFHWLFLRAELSGLWCERLQTETGGFRSHWELGQGQRRRSQCHVSYPGQVSILGEAGCLFHEGIDVMMSSVCLRTWGRVG